MRQMVRTKLFTALMIPMLLIPLASLGYAHFNDVVINKYKLHVAAPQIEIKDYKILAPCKWKRLIYIWPSRDALPTDTITIKTKIFPCWFVWIGLVLHNQGCLPANVSLDYVVDDPYDVWKYFIHKEYYYGPYNETELEAVRQRIWDSRKWWKMPPCNPDEPPIKLQPCERLVLWIKLKFKPPWCWWWSYYRCFKIKIRIKITAEPPELTEASSWTWP